jgi:hypothetical protein
MLTGSSRTIAGTVYGTIVAMSALAAGASAYSHNLWRLTAIVAVGSIVFWIAHVYAHSLAETITLGRRMSVGEFASVAHREVSIVFAAILPACALALGAADVISDRAAVWLALGAGTATLAVQGVRYARVENLGPVASFFAVATNVSLGGVIIALKVIVSH